ncbi:MAG TPA: hypothetical protein VGI40_15850 [Pirellulaceae bacterium]|jgi:hypothetical protein
MATPNRNVTNPKSLRPPQFGLRTLFALVAAICVLLALRQWISPLAIAALAFLAVSIFCHVAGNAIGTRLRQIGDLPEPASSEPAPSTRRSPKPQDFAPPTQLSRRSNLGWMIIVASSIGVTTGAIGGGLWTFAAGHGHVEPVNIIVGVIAFAFLGGIAAFATFGFVQVLGGAIRQAIASSPAANSHQDS